MKELLRDFLTSYEDLRGNGKLLPLCLAALILICLTYKRKQTGRRFHPAVFLLSIPGLIAYAFTFISDYFGNDKDDVKERGSKNFHSFLAIAFCVFAISISGNRLLSSEYFKKADNSLHIDAAYVEVMDIILKDEMQKTVIASPMLAPYFKQYSSSFDTLYDYPENGDKNSLEEDERIVFENLTGYEPDMIKLTKIAKKHGINYVVLENGRYWPNFPITDFGFEKFSETEGFTIYRSRGDYYE